MTTWTFPEDPARTEDRNTYSEAVRGIRGKGTGVWMEFFEVFSVFSEGNPTKVFFHQQNHQHNQHNRSKGCNWVLLMIQKSCTS